MPPECANAALAVNISASVKSIAFMLLSLIRDIDDAAALRLNHKSCSTFTATPQITASARISMIG